MPDLSNNLVNQAQVLYNYIPTSQTLAQSASTISNSVIVTLTTLVDASLYKFASPSSVNIGDVINYENIFSFIQVGTTITNIVLQDTVPNNTTFVPNSLAVDGVTIPGASLNPPGYTLAISLTLPKVFTVNFQVTANTVTQTTTVPNSSTGIYSYISAGTTVISSLNASSIDVTISPLTGPYSASMTKSVDKNVATIDDTLTYTAVINNGGLTANNAIFQDTTPLGTTFVEDSFAIGNITIPGVNPEFGIPLGTLGSNSATTLSFKVTISTIPTQNPIVNSATAILVYSVSNPNDTTLGINSNVVQTTVNHGNLSGNKFSDTGYASIGDTITYTIVFENIGNINSQDVFLTDTIPLGTTFVPGSVSINGITSLTANPQSPGILVGTIGPNATATVMFNVIITPTVPFPTVISNFALASYNYIPFPVTPSNSMPMPMSYMYDSSVSSFDTPSADTASGTTVYTQAISSTAIVTIISADLTASKAVDKTSANFGDKLTYTIQITNNGNATANSVQLSDKISSSLAIVPKSFKQDGILKAGSLVYPGLTLDSIPPKTTSVVTFNAKIIKIPTSGKIDNSATINYSYTVNPDSTPIITTTNTNTVSTSVNMANLSNIRKKVDKTDAKIDDILTYTISMTNTGNIAAYNVLLVDKFSYGAEFIPQSVTINGMPVENADPSKGINISTILPNEKVIVTFKVKVLAVIPPPCEIANIAKVYFEYDSGKCHKVKASDTSNKTITELASTQLPKNKHC